MGFFDTFNKVFKGTQDGGGQPLVPTSANQRKDIPVVYIDGVECLIKKDTITINIFVKNVSKQDVYVDKVRAFGSSAEIDANLRAGERREFMNIYKGDVFSSNKDSKCELDYRDLSGDYFRTNHTVDYVRNAAGIVEVKRIRYNPPVQDVF